MAYITKRGSSYSVRYTYQDEHGKRCDKWESFPTKEEATNRKKQIEHELAAGTFLIPSSVTVAEFLMDWLPKQCSKHKWAPKTYESNLSTIQNLIIPYIGSMEIGSVTEGDFLRHLLACQTTDLKVQGMTKQTCGL